MSKLIGNAVVAQGGGPTAVINQSLVGVVLAARRSPLIEKIYGARHGVRGIVQEDLLDLTHASSHNLEMVGQTPGSALFSTRDKPDAEFCQKIFKVLQAHNVRYFFYIGGNDSADTCKIVHDEATRAGYALRVVHIPKTIDNDLMVTDHCPGFGSAGKFVAQAFAGIDLDNRSLPGVYIGVVMGRHAGFLTAAAALARKYPDDGPHLIYLPEIPLDPDNFLADVDRVYSKYRRCVIAISEGITDEERQPIVLKLTQSKERDAHGNVQLSGTGALGDAVGDLVRERLKIKRVRCDTFGYLQRSFLGTVSLVDAREARDVGERAVQFATVDGTDGSVAIRRVGDYAAEYFLTPLETVAGKTKTMPKEFLDEKNAFVAPAFLEYARPLVGPLGVVERILVPSVPKILNK